MNLADRVRANPNASQAYAAEGGLGAYTDNGAGAVHDCSAAQLAAEESTAGSKWCARCCRPTRARWPVVAGTHGHTYTITLNWSEPGAASPAGFVMSVRI